MQQFLDHFAATIGKSDHVFLDQAAYDSRIPSSACSSTSRNARTTRMIDRATIVDAACKAWRHLTRSRSHQNALHLHVGPEGQEVGLKYKKRAPETGARNMLVGRNQ